jgi:hypothetical protein
VLTRAAEATDDLVEVEVRRENPNVAVP